MTQKNHNLTTNIYYEESILHTLNSEKNLSSSYTKHYGGNIHAHHKKTKMKVSL